MLLATAGPAYYRMCSTDVYCSKQTGSSSTKGNHHPSFLRFWNWAEENCRCSQNLWRRRNVVKTETQQTFVNGLLGFITLGIYTPLEARVLLTIIAWVAHRYGQLYLHCSLIYFWVPSSCFCIVISLSLRWNNPVQRCLPVGGEAALSTPEAVVASRTDWQTALMCNRRRPAATSSRRASFSALASANSFVYFASGAAASLTHLHVSNCRVRQLQFSGIFVALGFVGNGVITVMINSPWQADDDADNQAEIIAVTLLIHQSLWPFRPLLWILQSGCQPYARTTITSARQWSPDIAATVDCLTDITTINHR